MRRILLLGPSHWDPARGHAPWAGTPMDLRRKATTRLATHKIRAVLMEDVPNRPGEDILDKFRRLALSSSTSAIVVIWPPRAKMQTTYDELLLLREWRHESPPLWVLHHAQTFCQSAAGVHIREPGGRSRYLDALGGIELRTVPWHSLADLVRRLDQLGRNGFP